MFEALKQKGEVSKKSFERRASKLREQLLEAQIDLAEQGEHGVVVLICGVDLAGRRESIQVLHEWLDTRKMRKTRFVGGERDSFVDITRRIWESLPPKGQIVIHYGGWYLDLREALLSGRLVQTEYTDTVWQIQQLEKTLCAQGVRLCKIWLHLDEETQRQRLRELRVDRDERWRIDGVTERNVHLHEPIARASAEVLRATDAPWAPWTVMLAGNPRRRSLEVGQAVLKVLTEAPVNVPPEVRGPIAGVPALVPGQTEVPSAKAYKKQLKREQRKLRRRVRQFLSSGRRIVLGFEGWDAAGKGGAIRRVISGLDAEWYDVYAYAAPTSEERLYPFQWRFWRDMPREGRVGIYDRTWYGRVLVERVEGFASEEEWGRAYGEINRFERMLSVNGALVMKFWLQISPEEQLARFQARELVPYKRYKITEEDYRNRDRWGDYEAALGEILARTDRPNAPWVVVDAESKWVARLTVLRAINARLKELLTH